MSFHPDTKCTAFAGTKKIASGAMIDVALKVKDHLAKDTKATILVFEDRTSQQVELDLRGTKDAVIKRLEALRTPESESEAEKKSGPGRPKLGVVAKEVTLLPDHWDWLSRQPGGASVTLRRLVDAAKKKNAAKDELRQAQDAAYKFMTVMAGDLPNYEEALRALFANDAKKFEKLLQDWPKDVREHAAKLAQL
jgi:hypothetical protein